VRNGEGPVSLTTRKPKESGRREEVRNISTLSRIAGMPYLCNGWGQWAGNMGKGVCCFGFGERVRQLITEKSSVTENPLKLRVTRKERESERSQISQKDFQKYNYFVYFTLLFNSHVLHNFKKIKQFIEVLQNDFYCINAK